MKDFDYLLVGGGLQSGLLVLALQQRNPRARVALIESESRLGGNHTWSYHAQDVPTAASSWVERLTIARWPAYTTRFQQHSRTVASPYAAISSARFDRCIRAALSKQNGSLRLNARAAFVEADRVVLTNGEEITARCVIDSRGPTDRGAQGCGFQKFLGLEVEFDQPWPDLLPVIMDATVDQTDGFHFLYTLPLAADRVLIEDTYFSDSPDLNESAARGQIESRLRERLRNWRVVREESGVLPMPWSSSPSGPAPGPLRGGYGGGWFHPATGYSFPVALRFALAIAEASPEDAGSASRALARRLHPRWRFARLLNRLLFKLVPPQARWQIFARLYGTLPASLLARFYALEFSVADAARILVGRPPQLKLMDLLRLDGSKSWSSLSRLRTLLG